MSSPTLSQRATDYRQRVVLVRVRAHEVAGGDMPQLVVHTIVYPATGSTVTTRPRIASGDPQTV
jgi:hypothetical protein